MSEPGQISTTKPLTNERLLDGLFYVADVGVIACTVVGAAGLFVFFPPSASNDLFGRLLISAVILNHGTYQYLALTRLGRWEFLAEVMTCSLWLFAGLFFVGFCNRALEGFAIPLPLLIYLGTTASVAAVATPLNFRRARLSRELNLPPPLARFSFSLRDLIAAVTIIAAVIALGAEFSGLIRTRNLPRA